MYSVNKIKVDDKELTLIDIIHDNIEVTLMDYGATILAIQTPDKQGIKENVVMAYKHPSSYIENSMYLNATIGPTSGRIGNGKFTLNNVEYQLDKNFWETENLHGGYETFAFRTFDYEILKEEQQTQVVFTLNNTLSVSKYPGHQIIQIIYTIKDSEVLIEFVGTSDQDTLLNLTNHAYFNLSGNMKSTVLNHKLFINSSKAMELDHNFIPQKEKSTTNTYLDYTTKKPIKDNFFDGIYDLPAKGIDDPLLLDEVDYTIKQVELIDPVSKRKMEVYTTYPAIVCYTHNFPSDDELLFDRKHEQHLGICFETQNPPNGINLDGFEKSILRKEEKYYHKTRFVFSVEGQ